MVVVKTSKKKVMSLAFNVLKCNNVLSQQRLSFLLAMAVGLHHPLVVVELCTTTAFGSKDLMWWASGWQQRGRYV